MGLKADRRAVFLSLSTVAVGAALLPRQTAAQVTIPSVDDTVRLLQDPLSAARLELDFWLFAPLVMSVLYDTDERDLTNVIDDKGRAFAEGAYPRELFAVVNNDDQRPQLVSALQEEGDPGVSENITGGLEVLAERLSGIGLSAETASISRAVNSPVHVARLAPLGDQVGLFPSFDPCKIFVIGLICRLI